VAPEPALEILIENDTISELKLSEELHSRLTGILPVPQAELISCGASIQFLFFQL